MMPVAIVERVAQIALRKALADDLTCEICGSQMIQRQCKITCPNCGFTRDCSDP